MLRLAKQSVALCQAVSGITTSLSCFGPSDLLSLQSLKPGVNVSEQSVACHAVALFKAVHLVMLRYWTRACVRSASKSTASTGDRFSLLLLLPLLLLLLLALLALQAWPLARLRHWTSWTHAGRSTASLGCCSLLNLEDKRAMHSSSSCIRKGSQRGLLLAGGTVLLLVRL
jgi:uncharacterized membrane protein YbhN (UPF0104 family)